MLWRLPVTGQDGGWLGVPGVSTDKVFMQINGDITAIATATGKVAWKTNVRNVSTSTSSNIVVFGARVFTVDRDAVALDINTGEVLWRFVPDSASNSENAVDGRAFYVGTRGHSVYALDVASGAELWKTDVGPGWTYPGFVDGITVSGDTVYVGVIRYLNTSGGFRAGVIVALNRITGAILWTWQTADSTDDVNGAPVVSGRFLLANDHYGGAFRAIDRFAVEEVWKVTGPLDRFGPITAPVVIGDRVYFGSNDEFVYSVNLDTGQQLWKTFVGGAIDGFAVCGDRVFAHSFELTVLDRATGKKIGSRFSATDEFLTSRLASSGQMVFGSGNRAAYAFAC